MEIVIFWVKQIKVICDDFYIWENILFNRKCIFIVNEGLYFILLVKVQIYAY